MNICKFCLLTLRYLDCIRFIKKIKSGPFYEHSPTLNDISASANWTKVA